MSASVQTSPALLIGTPADVLTGPYLFTQGWDVMPDGRFLMIKDQGIGRQVQVVLNSFEELKEKVGS